PGTRYAPLWRGAAALSPHPLSREPCTAGCVHRPRRALGCRRLLLSSGLLHATAEAAPLPGGLPSRPVCTRGGIPRARRLGIRREPRGIRGAPRIRANRLRIPLGARLAPLAATRVGFRHPRRLRRGHRFRPGARAFPPRPAARFRPDQERMARASAWPQSRAPAPGAGAQGSRIRPATASGALIMATRTIGIMGRLLDQADGLGIYARHLLQHMVSIDSGSRYVIFLASPAASGLFSGYR